MIKKKTIVDSTHQIHRYQCWLSFLNSRSSRPNNQTKRVSYLKGHPVSIPIRIPSSRSTQVKSFIRSDATENNRDVPQLKNFKKINAFFFCQNMPCHYHREINPYTSSNIRFNTPCHSKKENKKPEKNERNAYLQKSNAMQLSPSHSRRSILQYRQIQPRNIPLPRRY